MSAKYTPGPWRLSPSDGFEIEDEIADITATGPYEVITLAEEVGLDDARLIASAPDLLAALTDVLRIAKAASIGVTGNAKRIAAAEAAIAKARGAERP